MCFVPEYNTALHNTTSLLHHIILGSQLCAFFLLIEIDKKNTIVVHVISLCLCVFVRLWLNRCFLIHTPPLLISLYIYPLAVGYFFSPHPPPSPHHRVFMVCHLSHKSPFLLFSFQIFCPPLVAYFSFLSLNLFSIYFTILYVLLVLHGKIFYLLFISCFYSLRFKFCTFLCSSL